MKKLISALTLGVLVLGGSGAVWAKPAAKQVRKARAPAAAAPAATAPTKAWDQAVTLTADGLPLIGNPAAPVKLIEYISYTCSHCAEFNAEAHDPLRSGMVRRGQVSVELRPFVRNELDLLPSLLALCGTKEQYFANNDALLAAQKAWFKEPADKGYQARWKALEQDKPAQRRVVAKDLGLYTVMQARGFSVPAIEACLTNQAQADRLQALTKQAAEKGGVIGTPSFVINGQLQDIYGWTELAPRLNAAITAAAGSKAR